jgi:hypothetical protein
MTPVKYYFYLELFPAVHYLLYLVKTRYKGCPETSGSSGGVALKQVFGLNMTK